MAQSQQASTARPQALPNAAQQLQGQNTAISQASVIVSLSGRTKSRGASSGTGENRALDASFEKQEIEEHKSEKGDGSKESSASSVSGIKVNIEA